MTRGAGVAMLLANALQKRGAFLAEATFYLVIII
jgi:hypothetical protein